MLLGEQDDDDDDEEEEEEEEWLPKQTNPVHSEETPTD